MSILFVVDPDPTVAEALTSAGGKYTIEHSPTFDGAFERLLYDEDIIGLVTEARVDPDLTGLDAITTLKKRRPLLPIVMISAAPTSTTAIEAVQRGAHDFVPKPVAPQEIFDIIDDALASIDALKRTVTLTPSPEPEDTSTDTLVGSSRAMASVYRDIARTAATPVTVLIRGETGTGKELVARALHQHGHRAHLPFIAVNCAAIPENLLESELFGHEKGAFTGASNTRIGRFEQAHGATLFLDEIGDMDLALQAKLLRVLQEKTIQRVGGSTDIPVDVRFIAATHQPLEAMIERGEFREDLFYRINAANVIIPPLRDRTGDVRLLIHHFVQKYAVELGIENPALTGNALSQLERHTWPGNIRELQNVVRRALIDCRERVIRQRDIAPLLDRSGEATDAANDNLLEMADRYLDEAIDGSIDGAYRPLVAHLESILLPRAVERSGGNLAKAARWLGITRLTLREKLRK